MSKSKGPSLSQIAATWEAPQNKTDEAVRRILQAVDSPRSLAVWLLYSNNEHQQLIELEIDAAHYRSDKFKDQRSAFRDDYLATNLLLKADFLSLEADPKAAARAKFLRNEERCRGTNRRFVDLGRDPEFTGDRVWLLNATIRKISKLLGESPGGESSFCPVEWFDACSWGPGTTALMKGIDTGPQNKFRAERGITKDLLELVRDCFPVAYPRWWSWLTRQKNRFNGHPFIECSSSVFFTVKKNVKEERCAAQEPGINMWFQKGLGTMLQRRILRYGGVDLRDQKRNGLLAFYASMSSRLATIDFSSASDLIATEVVRTLLPPRWFEVLWSARSHSCNMDGSVLRLEKFSSMGNGFTFPLQSLIFLAAALAVCERIRCGDEYVGVFGDDVVIPAEAYAMFADFCSFLGLKVNGNKSFHSGFFRESCGEHYLRGYDCRPLHLEERLSDAPSVFKLANQLRRFATRNMYYGGDRRFLGVWSFLKGLVPKKIRFVIPEGYGDGGFVGNFDEARPYIRRANGQVEGYHYTAVVHQPVAVRKGSKDLPILLFGLHRLGSSAYSPEDVDWVKFVPDLLSENENCRRTTRQVVKHDLLVPVWPDLGPWL